MEKVPIPLNSRTFVKNVVPHTYPHGTRPGMDWVATGGKWDDTDPRNIFYWGPPRPEPESDECHQMPGENPQNCMRRLKLAGWIGLYSARAEQDKKTTTAPPKPTRETGTGGGGRLEQLAAQVQESRQRKKGDLKITGDESPRRKTAAERREDARKERRAGDDPRLDMVPDIVSSEQEVGDDEEAELTTEEAEETNIENSEALEETANGGSEDEPAHEPETSPTPEVQDPPAPDVQEPTTPPPPAALVETSEAAFLANRVARMPGPQVDPEEDEDPPDEEPDAPVGGGGRAATQEQAPPPPAGSTRGRAGKGGLAGGGRRGQQNTGG